MIIIIQLYEQLFNYSIIIITKSLKYCENYQNVTDTKWANAVGKIPRGVLKSCNKPSICKKQKTQYLQSAIKWDMPVHPVHPNSIILWNNVKSGYWHWCSWCMVT